MIVHIDADCCTACKIFDEGLELYKEGDKLHEDLLIAYVKLVFKHTSAYPVSPRTLRDLLLRAMDIYPINDLFLSLFIECEARSQIAGRLRAHFDEACLKYVILIVDV
jgi:hypothetical protein